jgi:hypothetical protein
LRYLRPGVNFNTENADEWGLAVSGSVASRRALIGCCGRRCPNAPGGLKAVPTGRVQKRRRAADAASPRLARVVPTAPPPVPEADHVAVRAPCPCPSTPPPLSGRLRRRETLHGERSPSTSPLAAFSPGTLEPSFLSPSTPTQDRRRPLDPLHRRRTPPPIQFSPPSRRQEAPVSYRLHPHVRWVSSPPWVLERVPLLHLRQGSAQRAVTAPVCARAQRHAIIGRACRGARHAVGRVSCANGLS